MIRQTFTEQPHFIITKTSDCLDITSLEVIHPVIKVKLFCKRKVKVSGFAVMKVYTDDPEFENEIFVEGSLRYCNHIRYSVPSGLYFITNI